MYVYIGGMVLTAPFKGAKCLFVRGLGADVTDAHLEGVLPEVWWCLVKWNYNMCVTKSALYMCL
jgi:hypothetical protein